MSDALDDIPQEKHKGGMTIRYIDSNDKYVQYRLMTTSFSTTESNWQGVDKELVAGSHNLAESGAVYKIQTEVEGGYFKTIQFSGSAYVDKPCVFKKGKYHILVDNTWAYPQNVTFKDSDGNTIETISNSPVGQNEYDIELSSDSAKINFVYGNINIGYVGTDAQMAVLKNNISDLNEDVNGELLNENTWSANSFSNKACVLQAGKYGIRIKNGWSYALTAKILNSNEEVLYESASVAGGATIEDVITLTEASAYARFAGVGSEVTIYSYALYEKVLDADKRINALEGTVLKDEDYTFTGTQFQDINLPIVEGDLLVIRLTSDSLINGIIVACYISSTSTALLTISDSNYHTLIVPKNISLAKLRFGHYSTDTQTIHIYVAKNKSVESIKGYESNIIDIKNYVDGNKFEKVFDTSLYQQYASGVLADLNDAAPNTKYFLQLGTTNRPAHLPSTYSDKTGVAILETFTYTAYTGVQIKQQVIKSLSVRQGYFHIRYWHSLYGWDGWQIRTEKAIYEVGTGRQYTTLRSAVEDAVKVRNAEVYIYAGTYDLTQEFATELADSSYNQSFGIFLTNGVKLHFLAGSYVKAIVDMSGGDNVRILNWFSPFEIHGNFEIDGLNIEVQNTRYCVHDDTDGLEVKGIYRNCVMVNHTTSSNQYAHGQCIGGGIVTHKDITIDGCVFSASKAGDTNIPAVFYHNGDTVNDDSKIFVRNCRFADNNQLGVYSRGQSQIMSYMYICGCSLSNAEDIFAVKNSGQPYDNMDVIAWNNEFRDNL